MKRYKKICNNVKKCFGPTRQIIIIIIAIVIVIIIVRADGKRPDGLYFGAVDVREASGLGCDCPRHLGPLVCLLASLQRLVSLRNPNGLCKTEKYLDISRSHHFLPFALESMGPCTQSRTSWLSWVLS